MLNGKTYKVVVDHNDSMKGVYVRDIPEMIAEVVGEMIAETWQENKNNLRWFAGGMVVMAAIWFFA